MTDRDHLRRAGRPALRRLLGPTSPETFATQIWGRTLHLSSAADRGGDRFEDLFSLDAVDELVSDRGLRTPFLRVARDGATLPDRAFTSGGGIGAAIADQVSDDKLLQLFADGATIVLQGLHRTWGPVREFSAALSADLGHPVQVNGYVTPPQNQGFSDHYDVHDVFVLQVHGEKRWSLREPVLPHPLRDQPWGDRQDEVARRAGEEAYLETTLRPGDCLYLPRGWIHAARALGGVSTHLTIGVHAWTRHHLAESLLRRAGTALSGHDAVRESLPLGVDLTDPAGAADDVELAREALLRVIRELPAEEVVRELRGRERAAQRPAPVPPLAQLAAADALGTDTTVRLRPHLMADLLPAPDGTVVVSSRAGRFSLPSAARPAVELLLREGSARVTDLTAAAGLDEQAGLELARTLLRRGLAMPGSRAADGVGDTGGHG
ncbi:cupin domain-containing protein [Ornithinimicrobium flavum]|uniref:cupin domain-containing protein n=1 Tax=Ornithinimicrobium flavum TaxID=1288636 RepID=UPI00106FBC20|nr:cupin domain-containing protein [Ornithinimicrobium flavum]